VLLKKFIVETLLFILTFVVFIFVVKGLGASYFIISILLISFLVGIFFHLKFYEKISNSKDISTIKRCEILKEINWFPLPFKYIRIKDFKGNEQYLISSYCDEYSKNKSLYNISYIKDLNVVVSIK